MKRAGLRLLAERSSPPPGVDALLRAALADAPTAAEAWAAFERAADLDQLPGVEMCLIGLVSKRLPAIAPKSVHRGRVGGIERANWSRAQLVIGEAASALHTLATQDLPALLLGEAARSAAGNALGRGRPFGVVELCVRQGDMMRVHDRLTAEGWQAAPPGAVGRKRDQPAYSCRFTRGVFGSLEVRRSPYPPGRSEAAGADDLWQRAGAGTFGGAPALLPAATDALMVSIADGVRRSCFNGLWLADVAMSTAAEIDWPLVEEASRRQGLDAASFFSLRYARERLMRPIPPEALDRLERTAAADALHSFALLAECRSGAGTTRASQGLSRVLRRIRRLSRQ
ncbi:nucleotidyltransferase family protein [Ancylobacter sp.]|uniref:nucleotidyltransferase family protein n=1 Tax=Ancylobacter sp. TaxID=1872567 RepID=UPI003D13D304